MTYPKCSLLITTYNSPQYLALVLDSVINQSILPNEIVIGDDGSGLETQQLIDLYKSKMSLPIIHVWHEDEGFRLAKIRNKSIAKCNYEYIIQIDGDIILHKHFIKDHLHFARKASFVCGGRSLIKPSISQLLINKPTYILKLADFKKAKYALRLPFLKPLFTKKGQHDPFRFVLRCNMAYWKQDIININGYNEDFKQWGNEDNELVQRFINNDIKKRNIKFAALGFHLHHTESDRSNVSVNKGIFNATVSNKLKWCVNGLDKYISNN